MYRIRGRKQWSYGYWTGTTYVNAHVYAMRYKTIDAAYEALGEVVKYELHSFFDDITIERI